MTAAPHRLVKLPPQVSFNHAARFGYFGTSFAGLRMGGVTAGSWVGINGVTGTLGVGATLLALGMCKIDAPVRFSNRPRRSKNKRKWRSRSDDPQCGHPKRCTLEPVGPTRRTNSEIWIA